MKRKALILLLVFSLLLGILPSEAFAKGLSTQNSDLQSDWPLPPEKSFEYVERVKKVQIQYLGKTEKTLELAVQFQSTVSPIGLDSFDLRIDPRLAPYVESIGGQSTQYFGFETNVEFKNMDTASNIGNAYFKNVYRAQLTGAAGLFTGIPWGAEVYTAKVIIKLNTLVKDLPQDLFYTFQSRVVGTDDSGAVKRIDKATTDSATYARFDDEILTVGKSRWLKRNSTATMEYESGGSQAQNTSISNGRKELPFGQGVMRIKYFIYPAMLITDSYNAVIDQYKHYSFMAVLDPEIVKLIPDGAEITVAAVRRAGTSYNFLKLPKDRIQKVVSSDGKTQHQLRISVYGDEKMNNMDKPKQSGYDDLVTNHNMYIPADANGSMPTYVQLEIPIDETKAEQNFNYSQYNVQMYYYNKIGRMVVNSKTQTFTNAALTAQTPSVLNGTAMLYSDEVKGNTNDAGSTVYLVINPQTDENGKGIPGTGTLIGKTVTSANDFVVKTFPDENEKHRKFVEIINPKTGEFFKEGEKVYLFQASPGRMMSKGEPVTLQALQTFQPKIDPVYTGNKVLVNSIDVISDVANIITGSVQKHDTTSDIRVKINIYRNAALLDEGTENERIQGGSPIRDGEIDWVWASAYENKDGTPKDKAQNGRTNPFVVNRDGSFSYIKIASRREARVRVGDIVEVIAQEKDTKESKPAYFKITEAVPENTSRTPRADVVYATLPDANDVENALANKVNEKMTLYLDGSAKYRVEAYRGEKRLGEIPETESREGMHLAGYNETKNTIEIPKAWGLRPGDVLKIYQKEAKAIGHKNESLPATVFVAQHPDEYMAYTMYVHLEGVQGTEKDGAVEKIVVTRKNQPYPADTTSAILNYIQAKGPELPLPNRLIDFLESARGTAYHYTFNKDASTPFIYSLKKDYAAFWDTFNTSQNLQTANEAAYAGNEVHLYFGRKAADWVKFSILSGEHGAFDLAQMGLENPASADVTASVNEIAIGGILKNVDTWGKVKTDKGLPESDTFTPVANPGYMFSYFDDGNGMAYVFNDDNTFAGNASIEAKYDVDKNQFFGYEIRYIYMDGEEEKLVPGKDPIKGQGNVEQVIPVNQDAVEGFVVAADQPKSFKVAYIEQDSQNNKVVGSAEPAIRQVVKILYTANKTENPVILAPVYNTAETIKGKAEPYATVEVYIVDKDGKIENAQPIKTGADKNGEWYVPVNGLIADKEVVAVAQAPNKSKSGEARELVQKDVNTFTGTVTVTPEVRDGERVISGQVTLNDIQGVTKPELKGSIIIAKKAGVEIGRTVLLTDGSFHIAKVSEVFKAGDIFTLEVQPPRSELIQGEFTVAVNADRLDKAVTDGEEVLSDSGKYNADDVETLKKLVEAAKEVQKNTDKTAENQKAHDDAAEAIEEQLKKMGVNTAPVIVAEDKTVVVGSNWNDDIALEGVTVVDDNDKDLKATVKEDHVKIAAVGDYEVTYSAVDKSGKAAADKTINVYVVEANKEALKQALKDGEFIKTTDVYRDAPQEAKDALDQALENGKNVRDNKNATEAEVAEATKAINDALSKLYNSQEKSAQPTVNSIKNSDTEITGTAASNATVYVKSKDGSTTFSAKAGQDGNFTVTIPPAEAGKTYVITAQEAGKNESDSVEKTVGLNTEKLEKAIETAKPIVDKGLNEETSPIDKELKNAYENAKTVLENAKKEPAETTQKDVDDATKRLEDALKTKADKDAAKEAVDKAKGDPTDENIKDAKDKIDKLPDGEDKNKLQEELEKINKTGDLTINDLTNGAKEVTGTAPAGSKIEVKLPNGTSAFGKATPEGTYTVTVPALSGGDTITVIAKDGNKAPVEKTATVKTDVTDLKAAIGEGEKAMEKANEPKTEEDKALEAAIEKGKDLLEDPTNPESPAKPGVTQKQADDAAKAIRDAIKAKEESDNATKSKEKNIQDLKDAIGRGEKFLTENEANDMMDKKYKDDVQEAVNEAKKDLGFLEDNDPSNDPDQPKINKDIKDIDDAIAKAKNTMDEPTVDPIKNGANTVTGTTTSGAKVEVTLPNGNTVTTTAGDDGSFTVSTGEPLVSGETVVVKVTDPAGEKDPATKEVTVGLNTDELQKSVDKATNVVETGLDPTSNTDEALQDAYDKAKDVLDKAGKDPTIDQAAIDKAKKDLDDALAEKEKFEDAKSAVEAAKENPSKESIKNAQDKIDAMKDGADKDKLQKELDKVKLEDAIKRGEEKLKDDTLDPKSKEDLTNAVGEAKDILEKLNNNDPSEDLTKDKVNEVVKNIEDLIDGAKNKTADPTIKDLKKGDVTIEGTAEPKSKVEIKVNDDVVATVVTGDDGNYKATIDTLLKDKDKVVVVAQTEGKTPSNPVEKVVGVYKGDLKDAIDDGNKLLETNPNNPETNSDKKLKDAITEGEKVYKDPNATQENVDETTKKIRDAMDQKEAEDAVKELEDKQKAGEKITPEKVKDAQDKIDNLPGQIIDPDAPDYNKDKKDLQEKLDSVENLELLKHYVEQANVRLGQEDIGTKPAEIVNELTESKNAGQTIIDAKGEGSTAAQIEKAVDRIIKALEEIDKEFARVRVTSLRAGDKAIFVKTLPASARVRVFINGELVKDFYTSPVGDGLLPLDKALASSDIVRVEVQADGYLDNAIYPRVN